MNAPTSVPTFENQRASGQNILLPSIAKGRIRRTVLLEVNSRDRNMRSYPTSTDFRWKLFRPLKDVLSIQIVGGTVPTRFFNIDKEWNKFTFKEASTRYTVTLTPGVYTTSQLVSELQNKLNAIAATNTYVVSQSPTTDQLTITATGGEAFALLFSSGDFVDLYDNNNALIMINSPAKLLGFAASDYVNSSAIILSPTAADANFLTNRMYLYINQENNQDIATIERSVGKKSPYSIIYMDQTSPYKTFTQESFEPFFQASPAPIARLTTLTLSLRDEFDRILNFNGRDFTFLLEIVYLE
jgi:hypothetical protein